MYFLKSLVYLLIIFFGVGCSGLGPVTNPIEKNILSSTDQALPEAAIIIGTEGFPSVSSVEITPGDVWFSFKGRNQEVLVFPVKVGDVVRVKRFNFNQSYIKKVGVLATAPEIRVTEPGLYYYGVILGMGSRFGILKEDLKYPFLQNVEKDYVEIFSKLKHVNFDMQKEKENYQMGLKNLKQDIDKKIQEEKQKKIDEEMQRGLPLPDPQALPNPS